MRHIVAAAALGLACAVAGPSWVVGAPARHGLHALHEEEGEEEEADPPEVAIGERLFLETRFAQYFAAHMGGDVNRPLAVGDPVVDTTVTRSGTIPGPFAGQSMNCRACHLVDEQKGVAGGGNNTYGDFARRSPIPAREDGATTTPRNSPPLVNSALPRPGAFFLHFDGEFPSTAALVRATYTGRNFGWLPAEHSQAVAHVARVVREDDGTGSLAQMFGGAYATVLRGVDPAIPKDFRLPPRFRIDVAQASDDAVLDAVARLVAAYVESLSFSDTSPYDAFLAKNNLPGEPRGEEPVRSYIQRLRQLLAALDEPAFVGPEDGALELHQQAFVFGPLELQGLRTFLRPGSCVACHQPPLFTDFVFHNTGATQEDYDAVHGAGSFAALAIPNLDARDADPDAYLPASPAHPGARGAFRAIATPERPGATDLGLWNIFRNASVARPGQQRRLARMICRAHDPSRSCGRMTPAALLDASVSLFKTPGLRDLGHSAPYLHTGRMDTLEDVVAFYVDQTSLARAGQLRNGAPELRDLRIGPDDVAPLAAFLRSLNEDYE